MCELHFAKLALVRSRSKLRNEGRGQLCAKSFRLWQLNLFLPLRICGNHSNSKQSEAL